MTTSSGKKKEGKMHNLKDLCMTKTITAAVQRQKMRILPTGFSTVTPVAACTH